MREQCFGEVGIVGLCKVPESKLLDEAVDVFFNFAPFGWIGCNRFEPGRLALEEDIHEMSGFRFSVFFSTVTALALASGLCLTFLLFLPLIVFNVLILLLSIALVAALARIEISTFCFPSEPDETSMFGKIFLLSLAALVEVVGFNSTPLVVAAVAICPSSTKSMFPGEGFVLAPGFGVQLAGLKIWKEILKRSPLYT